jgi:hypothetical protein
MFQFCRRQADNYREQLGERFTSLICFSGDNEIVSICYARGTDPTTPVASHQSCIAYQIASHRSCMPAIPDYVGIQTVPSI